MQTYNQSDIGDSTIRSSKLKCFEGCSYLYYCNYILGVPQKKNQGSEKGSICHDLLEMLGHPKHRHVFDLVSSTYSIYTYKPIERLVRLYIKNSETLKPTSETLAHIDQMTKVGLKTDFWVEGGKIVAHEYKFEITNEEPFYKIKGFMDKVALKDDYVIIHDYKSSKRIYVGEDKESNVQSLIYHLAAKKIWPDKKVKVIFIFLAHPDNPILETEFNDDALKGFSFYLAEMQKRFDSFDKSDSLSNMAADKEPPKDGGFAGKLLCGFSKSKGQLKKDGTLMFACPVKWEFDYFVVEKDGKTQYSVLEESKIKLKDGETIKKMKHLGCPRYNRVDVLKDSFNTEIKSKVAYKNVLDDF